MLSCHQGSSHITFYIPMADELANSLCYYIGCGDAWSNGRGLRHAGEQHSSCPPDRAMQDDDNDVGDFQSPRHIGLGIYKMVSACFGAMAGSPTMVEHTPRTENWIFKLAGVNCD